MANWCVLISRDSEIWLHLHCATSNPGLQYRCCRVGRGKQPPSVPLTPLNTQIHKGSIINARFGTLRLMTDGRTKSLLELRVRNWNVKKNINKLNITKFSEGVSYPVSAICIAHRPHSYTYILIKERNLGQPWTLLSFQNVFDPMIYQYYFKRWVLWMNLFPVVCSDAGDSNFCHDASLIAWQVSP